MRRSLWFRLYVRISVRSCGSCGVALPHHEVLSIGTCRATRSKGCEKWALGDSTGLWRSLVVLHLCRRSVGLSSVRSGPGLYSQALSGPLRFSYTPFAIRLLCVVHLCCRFYWLLPCISSARGGSEFYSRKYSRSLSRKVKLATLLRPCAFCFRVDASHQRLPARRSKAILQSTGPWQARGSTPSAAGAGKVSMTCPGAGSLVLYCVSLEPLRRRY